MPQTSGRSTTLVASSRPPSPTSRMQASAGVSREGEEGDGGVDLEQAGADLVIGIEHPAHQLGEPCVLDQLAGDADALVVADQVRAGEGVDPVPAASSAARRKAQVEPLPLVPATWKTGGKRSCGRPRLVEQRGDPVEAEMVAVDRLGRLPVDQCRDARIRRADHFVHQAAFLSFCGAR